MNWMTRRESLRLIGSISIVGLLGCSATAPVVSGPPSAGSPTVSAGAQTEQALAGAAKREGHVTIYAATVTDVMNQVLAAFKTRYGLDATFERLTSPNLVQRFQAETAASNFVADVILFGDPLFAAAAVKQGWVTTLGDSLPALAQWPPSFWTGVYATIQLIPWNVAWSKTLVQDADAPKKWEDLLDPRWNGAMLLVDPRNGYAGNVWLYTMLQVYGEDYLRKLGALGPRLVDSQVPGAQQLAAGGASVMVPQTHVAVAGLLAQGAPIGESFPEPTSSNDQVGAVSANAPHPNAGRLLLNFLMGVEAQTILSAGTASPLPNVPGALPAPKLFTPSSPDDVVAAEPRMWSLLGIA